MKGSGRLAVMDSEKPREEDLLRLKRKLQEFFPPNGTKTIHLLLYRALVVVITGVVPRLD